MPTNTTSNMTGMLSSAFFYIVKIEREINMAFTPARSFRITRSPARMRASSFAPSVKAKTNNAQITQLNIVAPASNILLTIKADKVA